MTAQQIADKVNELIGKDGKCVDAILQHQTPCNVSLRDHPGITIHSYPNPDNTSYFVSGLSILNSLIADNKVLVANYDQNHDITGLSVKDKNEVTS